MSNIKKAIINIINNESIISSVRKELISTITLINLVYKEHKGMLERNEKLLLFNYLYNKINILNYKLEFLKNNLINSNDKITILCFINSSIKLFDKYYNSI